MPHTGKKILVVDDSNTNVVLLEAVFSSKGYKILTALNAREAFLIIEKETPAIILLDLLMPNISCFDFLADIKSSEKTSNIPVVIVSALIDDLTIRKCFSMGAAEYIKKPIDIPFLTNKVSEILQLNSSNV